MAYVLATTTWNSIDLVETFLRHYRRLGVDQILVMDFDSIDGTRDVLTAREWQGFVELVPCPGIAGLDSSNILLPIARQRAANQWCLFCDPDELLVTPAMTIRDLVHGELPADTEQISIPRFNVTAPLSVALSENHRLSALDALTLRIDGRHVPSVAEAFEQEILSPPWIYTAIPGKVLVRLNSATSIGDGDHVARSANDRSAVAAPGNYLLHFPFRTYAAFCNKIDMARNFYAANPQLPLHFGWQVRRCIRQGDAGPLEPEYLQQFIPDEKVDRLLDERTLVKDESIQKFHQRSEPAKKPS